MAEMEKDKNKHCVRKWYVAKGIDDKEVSFKDHDEGKTGKRGTPGKQEPRATSSDVPVSDPSNSSNMAMRGTMKRHDDEHGPEGVKRFETSSDDSNGKLVEKDPTLAVTSNQHPRETASFEHTST